MKSHDLLDMIGDVNEDYVRAADSGVVRPRFRWTAFAACAVLVLGVSLLPSLTAEGPGSAPEATRGPGENLVQRSGLHSYLLIEEERRIMTTQGEVKAPGGIVDVPGQGAPGPGGGNTSGGLPMYPEQGGDIPVQAGADYYERLLRGMGIPTDGSPAVYPDWFGGAWLDGDQGELLTVAIVYGFRTDELEEQIRGWCGGTQDIIFTGAIYSQNHLDSLMDRIGQVFEELDCRVFLSYGVYASDNCIHLDFSEVPGDQVLAALAQLDPEGDAIFIQVFTGVQNVLTGQAASSPSQPFAVESGTRTTPAPADGEAPAAYASAPAVNDLPQLKERDQAASYDLICGEAE